MGAFCVFALILESRPTPAGLAEDLRAAAACGDLAAIDRAIARGARVDAPDEVGATALIEAARGGHRDAADALIRAGADINRRTPVLGTPLMQAVINSEVETARLLLQRGADPTIANEYNNSSLSFADLSVDPEIISMLQVSLAKRLEVENQNRRLAN